MSFEFFKDTLSELLSKFPCKGNFDNSVKILKSHNVNKKQIKYIIRRFKRFSCFCDCEILLNL